MDAIQGVMINMRVPSALAEAIDDWRSAQPQIVSRSEAFRVLAQKGLETIPELPKRVRVA